MNEGRKEGKGEQVLRGSTTAAGVDAVISVFVSGLLFAPLLQALHGGGGGGEGKGESGLREEGKRVGGVRGERERVESR